MKDPIQLRKKPLKNGGYSLYLDYYHEGRREYRTLKMYLQPETDKASRELNKRTMEAAKAIQMREIMKLQDGAAGIKKQHCETRLKEYIEERMKGEKKGSAEVSLYAWTCWYKYSKSNPRLTAITPEDLRGFSLWLQETKSPNTAANTYGRLLVHIRAAYRARLIPSDPSQLVAKEDRPKKQQADREYLTEGELRQLVATPCRLPNLKQVFLFSCFTGLRLSDLKTLQWSDIQDGYIVKSMVKTGKVVRVPLSENARQFLPAPGTGKVFDMPLNTRSYSNLLQWAEAAGVHKHVTFHTARHTFATMLLTYGADLYTVSKLVGHSNISTTQIYAKIVDKKKEDAVNNLPRF